ncbi:glucosyl/glucuronosyl transferase [Drechmeria coniospora]|uniref:Glucosyl/glucuronosyl transferase n=1 Tax=Drechmeria coniospora TaxID=98403 RepID=A0A151GC11_DRECN|nr:glucosyl/glucuronosyl transferase [Drechmeria coniospora]KYK54591.1 glucosyl/glucuronosyl transferase [Drechmeria coniospora]
MPRSTVDRNFNDVSKIVVTDRFLVPEPDRPRETTRTYEEWDHPGHVHISHPSLEAGADVSHDGRVNIHIRAQDGCLHLQSTAENRNLTGSPSPRFPISSRPSLTGEPGKVPRPQLNVAIQIVGSRGDVQPFVALGRVLKDTYGHRVRIATHPIFQTFVEENDLEFFSIGGDPAELMAFMVKYPGLMPGIEALKSGEISKRRVGIREILLGCWRSCIEAGNGLRPPPKFRNGNEPVGLSTGVPGNQPLVPFVADAIIANPPSFAHIHVAEKLGIPLHMMFTMPWSPTRAFPHPLANVRSSNMNDATTNHLTYTLVEMMTWQGLGDVVNRFRETTLHLPPLSFLHAPGLLTRLKVPHTYCWSPALIPKPNDWRDHIDVAGFFFLNLASSFTPDSHLAAFLNAGPPPIYIGFGSIVVDDPVAMTRIIFDAIRRTGLRALVSKGWGDLGADDVGVPEGVHMLGDVPHDWLFERVSCVVHHGGAGTTAAGIRAGKPTLVIPFFGDQPFWGSMIARAKAGPKPIMHQDLDAEKLAEALLFCLRAETKEQARKLGERIREEQGCNVGAKCFHDHLDTKNLRCSMVPSRAAAWQVKGSKLQLSPLAASVLVQAGLLQYSDVALFRAVEYVTEDQPTDPISAGAASIFADLTSIGMAVADLPRELFRIGKRNKANPSEQSCLSRHSSEDSMDLSAEATGTAPPGPTETSESIGDAEVVTTPPRTLQVPRRDSSAADDETHVHVSATLEESIRGVIGAGRGVGHAVSTGVKSPMNFCLGLAKGFRNIPRLYNDDTVRPIKKVTGIRSGIQIAGKELGYGFFDGIAGLVTQPIRGAQKEGTAGLLKGVGMGVGGLIAKPAAGRFGSDPVSPFSALTRTGIWGAPAYIMQGAHAELHSLFSQGAQNHITTSRAVQGYQEMCKATDEEKAEVVRKWKMAKLDLENCYMVKQENETMENV